MLLTWTSTHWCHRKMMTLESEKSPLISWNWEKCVDIIGSMCRSSTLWIVHLELCKRTMTEYNPWEGMLSYRSRLQKRHTCTCTSQSVSKRVYTLFPKQLSKYQLGHSFWTLKSATHLLCFWKKQKQKTKHTHAPPLPIMASNHGRKRLKNT